MASIEIASGHRTCRKSGAHLLQGARLLRRSFHIFITQAMGIGRPLRFYEDLLRLFYPEFVRLRGPYPCLPTIIE
jgi:hypothetical protein